MMVFFLIPFIFILRTWLFKAVHGGELARLTGLARLAKMIFVPCSYEFSIPPDRGKIIVYK